jgi:hypothetical protein
VFDGRWVSTASVSERLDESLHELHRLRERTGPLTLANERVLPVAPGLSGVLPSGLQRGTTVTVAGEARVSLALALVSEATRTGSWVAVLGAPWLGWVAAAELGVALERSVAVADPGPARWAECVSALLDGFDLVLVVPPAGGGVRPADARRLQVRARQRGAVLFTVEGAWPEAAEVQCRADTVEWSGIEQGHGCLTGRRVAVSVGGRRQPRPRQAELWLPGTSGEVVEVEPLASVTELPITAGHPRAPGSDRSPDSCAPSGGNRAIVRTSPS